VGTVRGCLCKWNRARATSNSLHPDIGWVSQLVWSVISHVLQVEKSRPPSVGRALPASVPGLVGWAIDRCGDALAVDLTSASRTCQAPRVVADSSSGRAVAACAVGSGMLK